MLHTKGHMNWFWAPNSLQTVTAATKLKDACSLEEKPWQTEMHITKQRHHFANEGLCGQSYGFPSSHVQMRELTIKKAEHQRTDAFELWCWRRLLRVPWTAQRSNQSVLKEINLNIHWKDWCWGSNTLATWCEELTAAGGMLSHIYTFREVSQGFLDHLQK